MYDKTNDWARIEAVIKWAGKNTNSFTREIGLNRAENLYQIKRGRNGISKSLVESIVSAYPELNRSWILIGEGEMLLKDEEKKKAKLENNGVPYYEGDNFYVLSNYGDLFPTYFINIPSLKDCDLAVRLNSHALDPIAPMGSLAMLKRVNQNSVVYGDIYIIVTEEGSMLRRVRRHPESKEILLLRSDNNDGEVAIDRSQITHMYLVRSVIINFA